MHFVPLEDDKSRVQYTKADKVISSFYCVGLRGLFKWMKYCVKSFSKDTSSDWNYMQILSPKERVSQFQKY